VQSNLSGKKLWQVIARQKQIINILAITCFVALFKFSRDDLLLKPIGVRNIYHGGPL